MREKLLQLPPQLLEATTVPRLWSLSQTVSLGRARANILETREIRKEEKSWKTQIKAELRTQIECFFLLFYFGMGYDSAGGR